MVRSASRRSQAGLTYFWVLLLVFILALGVGKWLDIHSSQARRIKEDELLRVGQLYREAIRQYYLSSPNGVYQYPGRLEDLLHDPRHVVVRRYLRRLYVDPVSGHPFDILASPTGGIAGVRSTSASVPFRAHPPTEVVIQHPPARSYGDWYFLYQGE